MSGALAYEVDCRYCHHPICLARCWDGKWRSFDLTEYPAGQVELWAWRRGQGMQEQNLVPGHRLHFCIEKSHFLADQRLLREESRQPTPTAAPVRTRPAF